MTGMFLKSPVWDYIKTPRARQGREACSCCTDCTLHCSLMTMFTLSALTDEWREWREDPGPSSSPPPGPGPPPPADHGTLHSGTRTDLCWPIPVRQKLQNQLISRPMRARPPEYRPITGLTTRAKDAAWAALLLILGRGKNGKLFLCVWGFISRSGPAMNFALGVIKWFYSSCGDTMGYNYNCLQQGKVITWVHNDINKFMRS